jgi:hypothetical protein
MPELVKTLKENSDNTDLSNNYSIGHLRKIPNDNNIIKLIIICITIISCLAILSIGETKQAQINKDNCIIIKSR